MAARFVNIDHDTPLLLPPDLRDWVRQNGPLLTAGFAQVLELAGRCGALKVGGITVAIDGSKVLANASKHAAVS